MTDETDNLQGNDQNNQDLFPTNIEHKGNAVSLDGAGHLSTDTVYSGPEISFRDIIDYMLGNEISLNLDVGLQASVGEMRLDHDSNVSVDPTQTSELAELLFLPETTASESVTVDHADGTYTIETSIDNSYVDDVTGLRVLETTIKTSYDGKQGETGRAEHKITSRSHEGADSYFHNVERVSCEGSFGTIRSDCDGLDQVVSGDPTLQYGIGASTVGEIADLNILNRRQEKGSDSQVTKTYASVETDPDVCDQQYVPNTGVGVGGGVLGMIGLAIGVLAGYVGARLYNPKPNTQEQQTPGK